MKKTTLVIAAAFGLTNVFAQETAMMTNKKGEVYLPETNDWSIGIDATPFLNYVGNVFNGNTNNTAPTWNHLNANNTIIGKMFKDNKTAYRAILRLGLNSSKQTAMIAQAGAAAPTYPTLPAMVEDSWTSSSNFVGLGAGMEMRRGKTRLQGVYGADAMIWLSGTKSKYEYGNALSATNGVVANTTSFGTNITTDTYGNTARVNEMKNGTTIGIGVRGFIGAEYFVLPKLSIGAEFGWGIGFTTTGASETVMESVGGAPAAVGTQTVEGSKSSSFMLDTDRNAFGTGNGSLRVNLHF